MTAVSLASRDLTALAATTSSYLIRSGDTLSAIARQHETTIDALLAANPHITNPDFIRAGAMLSLPSGATRYSVRTGDTLSAIAARHGLDWRQLALDNGIVNPNLIFSGQTIDLSGARHSRGQVAGDVPGAAPIDGAGAAPGGGRNAADVARQYMGRNAADLRGDRSDALPMDANVSARVCCANFVSAVLTEAGQLPARLHTNSVDQLNRTLRAQGWTPVSASQARPGDVVIIQGGGVSHTEIVSGPGQMIGSNNRNSDGTQRISHGNLSWAMAHGGVILRAPASAQAAEAGSVASPTGPVSGTRQGRIDQAMTYFQSQGWTRAQAAGIVANLDAESGMDPNIRQRGGGPGYGLAQWEGPRQADFARFAGHDIRQSTFNEQLRFIQHELTTTERGAGARLRATSSAADAGAIVCRYYERPADTVGDSAHRAQLAQAIFQR